jgi:hypothetical protein
MSLLKKDVIIHGVSDDEIVRIQSSISGSLKVDIVENKDGNDTVEVLKELLIQTKILVRHIEVMTGEIISERDTE